MKKETALRFLRIRFRECRPKKIRRFRPREVPTDIYEMCLIRELMKRIEASEQDPIKVISDFYQYLDDVLCNSKDGQWRTHTFISVMERLIGDILWDLKLFGKENEE